MHLGPRAGRGFWLLRGSEDSNTVRKTEFLGKSGRVRNTLSEKEPGGRSRHHSPPSGEVCTFLHRKVEVSSLQGEDGPSKDFYSPPTPALLPSSLLL